MITSDATPRRWTLRAGSPAVVVGQGPPVPRPLTPSRVIACCVAAALPFPTWCILTRRGSAHVKLDENDHKEEFSWAYVHAVAAAAGFCTDRPGRDYGVDVRITGAGPRRCRSYPTLDVQVKATSGDVVRDDGIVYSLPVKNYDDLRWAGHRSAPFILVVVVVPACVDDWVVETEAQLAMRRCGYWRSLRGMHERANTATVNVVVPRSQPFWTLGLQELMGHIDATGDI